jgi:chitodextrinase
MKKAVKNFSWSLIAIAVFGINFVLIGATRSFAPSGYVGGEGIVEIHNNLVISDLYKLSVNGLTLNSEFSLNSTEDNLEFFTTEAYEIKSNNFVQLVAEPNFGYVFSHWIVDGVIASENIVYEFLMPNKDILISATYIQINAPTVQITAPIENSVYNTSDIIGINIDANSAIGKIEKVQLFINENLVSTFYELPYKYDMADYLDGKYTIKAVATDNTGQFSASKLTTISIEKTNLIPTVSITAPADNAQFTQGDNISITANASDTDGTITKVEFFNGNTLLGTDTTSPYSFAWTNLPVGSFTLTAKATDNNITSSVSAPVAINVVDKSNLVPTVSITAPAANAQFTQGDNISITANAADADGTISKVEFFNGNTLLGIDTTSPYSFAWTNLPVGSFNLTAKATDNKGTATVSTNAAINVVAKANVAPTVSITAPAANAQFTQGDNISITANAADADGTITKVEFFNGSTLLGTDTTSPYSFAWTNLPVGSFSLTTKATDDKGTATVSTIVAINVVAKANVAPAESFTLINADTNQDMFDLTDGMQIGGSTVSGLNLNVRFNTSPSVVGSVYFTLAGRSY